MSQPEEWPNLRKAFVLAAVLAAFALLWYVSVALTPMVLGALFGIFLYEIASYVRRVVPLGERWSVSLTLILLVAIVAVVGYLLGRSIVGQFSQLMDVIPQGLEAARQWLAQQPRLHAMLQRSMAAGQGAGGGSATQLIKGLGSIVELVFKTGVAGFIVFFTGVFLAFSPGFYSSGVLAVVPREDRPRWKAMLGDLWRSLWLWTLGRLLVMGCIAVAHIIAYWLLGVPLPFALGVIAGVLAFIPFLGPIAATIPAGLVALTKSPELFIWVVVVHTVVQTIESHVLTPLTQEYMVDVPSLITIASFIVLGKAMGIAGVIVATPLSAALLVIGRHLYIPKAEQG